MARKKSDATEEPDVPKKVTDIEAVDENTKAAVYAFVERWMPLPRLVPPCETFSIAQLRDAMGLRATIDWGDPWPAAEQLLLQQGFRWQQIGGSRVMIVRERDDAVQSDGFDAFTEVKSEELRVKNEE